MNKDTDHVEIYYSRIDHGNIRCHLEIQNFKFQICAIYVNIGPLNNLKFKGCQLQSCWSFGVLQLYYRPIEHQRPHEKSENMSNFQYLKTYRSFCKENYLRSILMQEDSNNWSGLTPQKQLISFMSK